MLILASVNEEPVPQLAIYCNIEERQVSHLTGKLQPGSDCPDMPRLEGRLRSGELVLVPGAPAMRHRSQFAYNPYDRLLCVQGRMTMPLDANAKPTNVWCTKAANVRASRSDVRCYPAASTGRCNTSVESLCRRFKLQGFARPFVELPGQPHMLSSAYLVRIVLTRASIREAGHGCQRGGTSATISRLKGAPSGRGSSSSRA